MLGLDGSLTAQLGDSNGLNSFEIENGLGSVVFSVDTSGEIKGEGIFESGWVEVSANSSISLEHNLNRRPKFIDLQKADDSVGSGMTMYGLGIDYYYKEIDKNKVEIYNDTEEVIWIKLIVMK